MEEHCVPAGLTRWILFLSSYAPLFVIVFVLYRESDALFAWTCLLTAALGVVGLSLYFFQARTLDPFQITVTSVQPKGAEAMAYIVTYVIPFLDLDLSGTAAQLSIVILLLVMGLVYVRSNLIYVNPLLSAAGLQVFEITAADNIPRVLLAHRDYVRPGDRLWVAQLGHYLYLQKQDREETK
jgi:hypothetical protein